MYSSKQNWFLFQAKETESLWVQTVSIFCVGVLATLVSIFVPIVYGLFVLAADIVFVIVLPQLFCAVFLRKTNAYGAIPGFLIGTVLRVGAGEVLLDWQPFIEYPMYSKEYGQQFPFRTFAMVVSLITIVALSLIGDLVSRYLCNKSRHDKYHVNSEENQQNANISSGYSSSHPLISLPSWLDKKIHSDLYMITCSRSCIHNTCTIVFKNLNTKFKCIHVKIENQIQQESGHKEN